MPRSATAMGRTFVRDYASHPLRSFLERGLLATLNTDDPRVSGIDLPHEYRVAAPAAGLSREQVRQAQRNALQIAFLPPAEKAVLARARAGDGLMNNGPG